MKKLFIILLLIVSLISCTTLGKTSAPSWVYSEPRILGSVVFIGNGEGESKEIARANAYADVIAKLSDNIGRNLASLYYRELLSKGTIEDLSTTVEGEYFYKEGEKYIGYVMTVTPSRVFNDSRSPEYLALLDREARIKSKLDDAINAYSENKDIEAIDYTLDAIIISLEGDVNNSSYQHDTLRDRAISYISKIKISVEKKKSAKDECRVRVKRDKGLFSPAVASGYIKSEYNALNSDGDVKSEYFISKTDKKGRFFFNRTDPYALLDSTYKFMPYVDDAKLKEIEAKTDSSFVAPIYEAIESASEYYEYKRNVDISSWAVSISSYDSLGNLLPKSTIYDPLNEHLEKVGLSGFASSNGYGDSSEEDFEVLSRIYPDKKYFFVFRTGVVDSVVSTSSSYVKIDSSLVLYNRDGEIQKSRAYSVAGLGKSYEEAERDSFERTARIASNFFLEEL